MTTNGSIAGLAAAVGLADEGFGVTLIEKRALLGGRASSFIDPESGDRVDNCQHVTMRCCTNLEDFYRRIGVLDKIHYHDDILFLDSRGVTSSIRCRSSRAALLISTRMGPKASRAAAIAPLSASMSRTSQRK